MITEGFVYVATLIGVAAFLIYLPKIWKGKASDIFFSFAPPVVLIYLVMMILCTFKVWDIAATAPTYSALKNPILYAMVFIMLLRCDMKKIVKLGPKMLIGFFSATFSIGLGFLVSHMILGNLLGENSWKSLGALCGSWMGGGGNMLAIQAALEVSEADMGYALVMDSVCASFYVMFLLWAIGFSKIFNKWTKADTKALDEVGASLEEETKANISPVTFQNMILILGMGLVVSAFSQYLGGFLSGIVPFFDKGTWTVLVITVLGTSLALTPIGKLRGIEEISNVMLYITIALIASRADLTAMENAHWWLLAGFIILIIHVFIMIILAKLLRLDIFTCCVASLANVGGTATAPVLAGTYNSALVPVGIVMALLGYIIGTPGGLIVSKLMEIL